MVETIVRRTILEKVGEDFGPEARVRFTLPNGAIVEVCHAGRQDPEVRPWPANDLYDLIHYETTETGKWALRLFDKYEREGYPAPCPEAYRLVRDGSK